MTPLNSVQPATFGHRSNANFLGPLAPRMTDLTYILFYDEFAQVTGNDNVFEVTLATVLFRHIF